MAIQYIVHSWVDAILAGLLGVIPAYHPILLSFSRPELAVFAYFLYYVVSGPVSFLIGAYASTILFSRLAAHSLVVSGRSRRAVFLYLVGFLGGLLLSVLYYPVSGIFSAHVPAWFIFLLLLLALVLLVIKSKRPLPALFVGSLAAVWGITLLSSLNPVRSPLQVGISGIFGIGAVIPSLASGRSLPLRPLRDLSIPWVGVVFGVLAALLVAYFPALSPAVAALFIQLFVELDMESVVAASGSTASASLVLSIYSRHYGLTRSSLAASVPPSVPTLALVPYAILAAALGALFLLAIFPLLYRVYSRRWVRVLSVLFVVAFVLFFFGVPALFAALAGAALSVLARSLDVDQNVLMAFLIFPTMLYYAPV